MPGCEKERKARLNPRSWKRREGRAGQNKRKQLEGI